MATNLVIDALEKVELTEAELVHVVGGVDAGWKETTTSSRASAGLICTFSGECFGGVSCNPFWMTD